MPSTAANAETLSRAVGQTIEVKAAADHSPKTKHGAHPVYKLETITKIAGRAFKPSSAHDQIKGVVAAIHYAKHGEPNGVILKSGEFIHTRPHGMKKLKLKVGSKVTASGELRMTVLGTSLIEAHEVNRGSRCRFSRADRRSGAGAGRGDTGHTAGRSAAPQAPATRAA
jgi:hypothetical protein